MEYISLGSTCATANFLHKYNTNRYPFDWCNITIKQLNQVLENDFMDYNDVKYYKTSHNHKLIDMKNDNIMETSNDSIIVRNKYNISFAHEISQHYEIDEFKSKLSKRIDQFKTTKEPYFVRFEYGKCKSYYNDEFIKLYKYLESQYGSFKLLVIVPNNGSWNVPYDNVIYYPDNDYVDWKYEHIFNSITL